MQDLERDPMYHLPTNVKYDAGAKARHFLTDWNGYMFVLKAPSLPLSTILVDQFRDIV